MKEGFVSHSESIKLLKVRENRVQESKFIEKVNESFKLRGM